MAALGGCKNIRSKGVIFMNKKHMMGKKEMGKMMGGKNGKKAKKGKKKSKKKGY